ncbi:MAG TPA: fasciclin domain-containing protein [Pyrinomonadaceae bacterium]|nr:fasciclin domain-containing protein [Pyrinomonadaceae bacterium]
MATQYNLIDTALRVREFSTLATALAATDMVDILETEGPFTVFAPTDDAFSKMPAEMLDDLLEPENRDRLTSILNYHVVPGRLTAHEVANLEFVTSVLGQRLTIERKNGLKVNEAAVVTPDVEASNGIIHIIDAVLIPAAAPAY